MIAALDAVKTVTGGVLAFFALIAVITVVRIILRREASAWSRLRVGFFIERDRDAAEDYDPPDTQGGPE